jgi:hypothetical protein
MDHVISYKGFHIHAFEQTQGCWLAEIRRATGGWIIVGGERREVLTTSAIRRTMLLMAAAWDKVADQREAALYKGLEPTPGEPP